MNKCPFVKELSAYLDNQLPQDASQKVEEHIRDCKICAEEISQLILLSEKLKNWQAPEVDARLDNMVRDRIVRWELERGKVKMKKNTLAIFVPTGAIVAILFVVLAGQLYLKRGIQGKLKASTTQYEPYYMTADRRFSYGVNEPVSRSDYEAGADAMQLAASVSPREKFSRVGSGVVESYGYATSNAAVVDRRAQAPLYQEVPEGSVIVIQPTLPATGEGQMIIRTADVRLEVEDGQEAYKNALAICQELGGYVAQTRFYKDDRGRQAGQITMRIPKDKFMTALDKVAVLGKVENSTTDTQDVSQEYKNLKSRLDAALVVYNKMLESLQKRQTTIPEAMRLESELTPVLQRIEELKNRVETLNNLTSFTTITLNFHESRVSIKVLRESGRSIRQSLLATAIVSVKLFADSIPVLLTIAFWLILVLAVVAVIRYGITRLRKR